MPHFKLDTNVSKDKVTPEFLKQTSKIIASALGKPESVSILISFAVIVVVKNNYQHLKMITVI